MKLNTVDAILKIAKREKDPLKRFLTAILIMENCGDNDIEKLGKFIFKNYKSFLNELTKKSKQKNIKTCFSFRDVMKKVKDEGLVFKAKDGVFTVGAECFTDDPELLEGEAFFDVFTDWEVTAHSPITDTVIFGICHEIEKAIGGKWCYNPSNNAIEQMTM